MRTHRRGLEAVSYGPHSCGPRPEDSPGVLTLRGWPCVAHVRLVVELGDLRRETFDVGGVMELTATEAGERRDADN